MSAGRWKREWSSVGFLLLPWIASAEVVRFEIDSVEPFAEGLVEFSADLFLLVPSDRAKANGAILHEVNNRGNKLLLSWFNGKSGNDPKTEADAGMRVS